MKENNLFLENLTQTCVNLKSNPFNLSEFFFVYLFLSHCVKFLPTSPSTPLPTQIVKKNISAFISTIPYFLTLSTKCDLKYASRDYEYKVISNVVTVTLENFLENTFSSLITRYPIYCRPHGWHHFTPSVELLGNIYMQAFSHFFCGGIKSFLRLSSLFRLFYPLFLSSSPSPSYTPPPRQHYHTKQRIALQKVKQWRRQKATKLGFDLNGNKSIIGRDF